MNFKESLDEISFGHLQIQQQNIRFGALHDLGDLVTSRGLSNDKDILFQGENSLEPLAKEGMIIGDHDFDGHHL